MITKKVPLTVYHGGKRYVVGDAVVDIDGAYVSIEGKVDAEYEHLIRSDVSGLSFGPFSSGEVQHGDSSGS